MGTRRAQSVDRRLKCIVHTYVVDRKRRRRTRVVRDNLAMLYGAEADGVT
jgi:hypothetical protein